MRGPEEHETGAVETWESASGEPGKLCPEDDWEAAAVVALVARTRRVSMRLLLHPRRCRAREATARHLTMYLMHVMLGRSLAEIGRFFGRDRTTVGYACARIEDLRERSHFDSRVAWLEREIAARILADEERNGLVALEDHRHAA